MWIQPYTQISWKKNSHTCTNPSGFFFFFFFFRFDWYPHETPGKCLLLALSWDEQDWQHGALEKCNLSVACNWKDLTGSELICFSNKKPEMKSRCFHNVLSENKKVFPVYEPRAGPLLWPLYFFVVKCRIFHAVCIGGGEMQEKGEEKINMFLCKLSQTAT